VTTLTKNKSLRSAFTLLFALLVSIGCFIKFPVQNGVYANLQSFFGILAGCILGGIQGAGSVGIFILLGAVGVPVYSGNQGGMDILIGSSGGFIWGIFIGSLLSGIVLGTPHIQEKEFKLKTWLKVFIAAFVGYLFIYIPGVPWYKHIVSTDPENNVYTLLSSLSTWEQYKEVIKWTVKPYLFIDFIKLIITVPIAAVLRPIAAKYLYPDDQKEEEELINKMKQKKDRLDKITSKKKY